MSKFTIDEGERQAILLAIAKLALERPGYDYMLGQIAEKLHGRGIYNQFKSINSDTQAPNGSTMNQFSTITEMNDGHVAGASSILKETK